MLTHPTLDQLGQLGLTGMAQAFAELEASGEAATLNHADWIETHDNLILCGPTGVGKSWLACALGHKACRDNRSVLYQRVPKLFTELALARGDGRYARILRSLTGVQLLILDDWGPLMPVPATISTRSSRSATAGARRS